MEKLSAAEAAKLLGVSIDKLVILEKQGVISVIHNAEGVKTYSASEITKIKSRRGLTLAEEASQVDTQIQHDIVSSVSSTRKILITAGAALSGYVLLVVLFAVLFMVSPIQTAKFLGIVKTNTNGILSQADHKTQARLASRQVLAAETSAAKERDSAIQTILKPIGKVSLGIIKNINPASYEQVSKIAIIDPNDVLGLDTNGAIILDRPINLSENSPLKINNNQLVSNLNSQYLQGKQPGTSPGDIAIVGDTSIPGPPPVLAVPTPVISGLTNSNLSGTAGISNANLANPSVTVDTSGPISGGGSLSLGGSLTLSCPTCVVSGGSLFSASSTDTLTNKTIDAASNTISGLTNTNLSGTAGISNANLANSSLTFAGNSGSGSVSLGGTLTLTGAGITNIVSSGSTLTLTSTEADTLSTVTGRGATTSTGLTLNGGITTTTTTALTLDSGTTGGISIGTGANAKTITIGNNTGATALNLNSGSGGIVMNGNISVSGSNSLTTGTGLTTISGTSIILAGNDTILDMTGTGALGLNTTTNRGITLGTGAFTQPGDYATPKGTDYSSTGTQNNVNLGTGSLFRYTGAGTATFTGFSGGTDGRLIRIMNASSSNVTISNQSASSLTANRIITGTGTSSVLGPDIVITLQYDSTASRWRIVSQFIADLTATAFVTGGNSFSGDATLGTTDAFGLNFITTGSTRFGIAAGSATLTGTGATSLTSTSTLSLTSAAASGLTLDSGTTGAINLGTGTNAKTITIGNNTSTTAVNINSGTGNVNFTVDGTASSGKVQIGNSGTATPDLLVLDNGTADPTGVAGGMYYNTSTTKFRCFQNGVWTDCIGGDRKFIVKGTDENVPTGTTLQNDDALTFSVGSGETWIFQFNLQVSNASSAVPDWKSAILGASGWTCSYVMHGEAPGTARIANAQGTDCDDTPTAVVDSAVASDSGVPYEVILQGSITTTSAGSVTLQWAPNTSGSLTVKAGSFLLAQKVGGADLAEVYYTKDASITPGDIVSLDGSIAAGVKKSTKQYDPQILGIISTKPGLLLGDGDTNSENIPVILALAGRVPVKVTTENGAIQAGDYLTSSSTPGVAMKATHAGTVIGTALTPFEGDGIGQVLTFVRNGSSLGSNSNDSAKDTLMEWLNTSEITSNEEVASSSTQLGKAENIIETKILAQIKNYVSELFKNIVEFFGNVIFHDNVTFLGRPTFNKDTAGHAFIKAGEGEVNINFEKEYVNNPVVTANINLNGDIKSNEVPSYAVYDVSSKGFKIKLSQAAAFDLNFSWIALAVKEDNISTSNATPTVVPSAPIESESVISLPSPTEIESSTSSVSAL